MAYLQKASFTFTALAIAGLVGCGGSDQNTQPQTPPSQSSPSTTDTTMTTGAQTPGATGSSYGQTPTPSPADKTSTTNPSATTPGTSPIATTPPPSSGTDTSNQALSDEQIAAVTNAANTGEVDQAKEAIKKAKNGRVKTFAQHMVTDHGAAFKQQTDLEKKGNITPQDNELSRQVQNDGKTFLSQLQSAPGGNDFDKQYMDIQVREHQQVLDSLDNKLIPNAKNADLKSYLQKVRDKVADHLKQAKDIQASLK